MKRMGESGADRGQEIYYMKCWMCHNDYTRKVDPQAAPTLQGLFKRTKLMSGKDVNQEHVLTQIEEGSANMPSYKAGFPPQKQIAVSQLASRYRLKIGFYPPREAAGGTGLIVRR